MENVLAKHALVTKDGAVNFVTQNRVMPDVTSMVNAKMVPVYVSLVGTENTVPLKDVQLVARIMDNVELVPKDYGNVVATMDGTEPIVQLHWK